MTIAPTAPFFIVGHPRSGTTLLRFLLASHPRLYIPEETGFVPYLVKKDKVRADLSIAEVRALLERMGRLNYLWQGIVEDVPAFYRSLPHPSLSDILDALYKQQIAEYGAVRWGDKTPLYVQHIPLLVQIFAEAQFIHVIRDGRDATLSALKKWPERGLYMDHYYLLENWVANVQAGRATGPGLGDHRYLEVRYETMVQQPEATLRKVCAFLGETFLPEMLDQTRLAGEVGPGPQGHVEVQQPIFTGSIGHWTTGMAPFYQKMADRIAGPTLTELGYELADLGPLSSSETIRFLLLAARYQLASGLRRALYRTGVLTLNRDLRR